jgi:hypothetical protein
MRKIATPSTIGLDIAKSVFQVHGIDAQGKVVVRQQLKRHRVLAFFGELAPQSAPRSCARPADLPCGGLLLQNTGPVGTVVLSNRTRHPAKRRVT